MAQKKYVNTIYTVVSWASKVQVIEIEFFYPIITIRRALTLSEDVPKKKLPGIKWRNYEKSYEDEEKRQWVRESLCGRFVQIVVYAHEDGSI